jgi:hypothetical protein
MKKTFYLVIAGVALAIIGATAALYFLLKMRNELEAAAEDYAALKHDAALSNLNHDRNEETSKVAEGPQNSADQSA